MAMETWLRNLHRKHDEHGFCANKTIHDYTQTRTKRVRIVFVFRCEFSVKLFTQVQKEKQIKPLLTPRAPSFRE